MRCFACVSVRPSRFRVVLLSFVVRWVAADYFGVAGGCHWSPVVLNHLRGRFNTRIATRAVTVSPTRVHTRNVAPRARTRPIFLSFSDVPAKPFTSLVEPDGPRKHQKNLPSRSRPRDSNDHVVKQIRGYLGTTRCLFACFRVCRGLPLIASGRYVRKKNL